MGGPGSGGKRRGSFACVSLQGVDASMADEVMRFTAPAFLPEAARDAFLQHRDRLGDARLLANRDVHALAIVAVIETVLAGLLAQPLAQQERAELRQWLSLYRLCLADVGASPTSRSRVQPVPPPPADDEFAQFLRDDPADDSVRQDG